LNTTPACVALGGIHCCTGLGTLQWAVAECPVGVPPPQDCSSQTDRIRRAAVFSDELDTHAFAQGSARDAGTTMRLRGCRWGADDEQGRKRDTYSHLNTSETKERPN
jgi:hypothetical protein